MMMMMMTLVTFCFAAAEWVTGAFAATKAVVAAVGLAVVNPWWLLLFLASPSINVAQRHVLRHGPYPDARSKIIVAVFFIKTVTHALNKGIYKLRELKIKQEVEKIRICIIRTIHVYLKRIMMILAGHF
jgi:hypothetical protein